MADFDIYDDDYWRGSNGTMLRRQGYFEAMDRLDALSRELTEQAHNEYLERERRKAELEADGETSAL
jgi:hypothetical protein